MRGLGSFVRLPNWLLTSSAQQAENLDAFPRWLHSPAFIVDQWIVLAITLLHHRLETALVGTAYFHFHYVVPVLYFFPILHSSVRFRLEAGRWTAFLSVLLATPNIVASWPHHDFEWVTELLQLIVGVAGGLIVSILVEQGAAQRRRARDASASLSLLHHQLTKAQEEERKRISRELHDETAQRLVILCRGLDGLAATLRLSRSSSSPLQEVRSIAEDVLADVRRFSRRLRPAVLDDLGLVPAVEWLAAESAKRQGFDIRVDVIGPPRRLSPETELALFRIVQESLHNVEKHAEASLVAITLSFERGLFCLTVADDGLGFKIPASLSSNLIHGKLGLVGIQERVQLLDGNFDLQTAPGAGTRITVSLDQ